MHPMFPFPNTVFKHPVALLYNLLHIYFRLKCNLYSHLSSTVHGSALYCHNQVSSIFVKYLHCMSKFRVASERDIS
jgi:hypothetical protein